MTKAQVEAHAHRREGVHGSTSLFPSASRKPISAKAMLKYQYSINGANARFGIMFPSVRGTVIPWRDGESSSGRFSILSVPMRGMALLLTI